VLTAETKASLESRTTMKRLNYRDAISAASFYGFYAAWNSRLGT
jgi:hypothetical protein